MSAPSTVRLPCKLPLDVAPAHVREFEQLARAVRDQTVELYEAQLASGARTPDAALWKRDKQRETATVYVARERHAPPTAFHRGVGLLAVSPQVLAAGDWAPQLRLRLVGTMLGSLDDAMLGAVAPSTLATFVRSASLGDDLVDHRVLLEIRRPSTAAPFAVTTLKWSARKTAIASLVKARDMVYVEASGFTQLSSGERVGFVVYHSLTLPQLPPLDASHGLVRSRVSVCHLFRQASPGVVELFSTMALCAGGGVPAKVAALQAADVLLAASRVAESARKKKLVWMQTARAQGAPKGLAECFPGRLGHSGDSDGEDAVEVRGSAVCSHCARALSALRSVTTCEVCETPVCSRCVTSQKLVFGLGKREVRLKALNVCSGCTATSQRADNAAALAVFEFVQPLEHKRRARLGSSNASTAPSSSERRSSTTTSSDSCDLARSGSALSVSRVVEHAEHQYQTPHAYTTSSTSSGVQHTQQRPLWEQMNDLCLRAEHTYHETAQHSRRVHSAREDAHFADSFRR